MGIAAAVVGAGALGLAGTFVQSNAAQSAADQQAASANNALQLQQNMFGTAQNALNPYINAGTSALPTLQNLLTPGQSASQLAQMPGFKFQSKYGDLAATNQLAAQGLGGSGGPLGKALSDYNNGLAGSYYGNTVSALQNFVNTGANSASALAGNAISSGNSQGNSAIAVGNAQASGTLGAANATASGLGGIGNSLIMSQLLGSNNGIAGTGSGLFAANSNIPAGYYAAGY